jgi:putative membrane protein
MKKYYFLLSIFFLGLIWSGINPRNYGHWIGEAAAPIVGLIILISTFKKFRYTLLTYSFILLSCWLMFIGAHYTFSRVPLFDWIRDYFGQDRNNFDKLGHFFQGIIPILITRELFIRRLIIRDYKWISFISFCICMATTSVYELIEFIACQLAGKSPNTFLGTQGYVWDSQSDMFYAAIGGLIMLLFFRKSHDRIIEKEFPGSFENFRKSKLETNSTIR